MYPNLNPNMPEQKGKQLHKQVGVPVHLLDVVTVIVFPLTSSSFYFSHPSGSLAFGLPRTGGLTFSNILLQAHDQQRAMPSETAVPCRSQSKSSTMWRKG